MKLASVFAIAITLAATSSAQSDPLAILRVLEGKWEGKAAGEPGKGVSTREYRFDMNGRYLSVRNKSVWEPKTAGGKSEIHEDFGMFSYDRALKKIILRQFHIEGFVNEYTLDSISEDGKSLEFVTNRIENIPQGWRAKESYRFVSSEEFVETFYLAAPAKEFAVYSETKLRRVK